MGSGNHKHPSLSKIVALHLLGFFMIVGGVAQGLVQGLEDGFLPVPFGITFVILGAFLWIQGARARLVRSRRRETA